MSDFRATRPTWVHGKRKVVDLPRLLSAAELEELVCAYDGCAQLDHLAIPPEGRRLCARRHLLGLGVHIIGIALPSC